MESPGASSVGAAGSQFGQANGTEQRERLATDCPALRPGHHRHAHPERFTASQPARDGKGVECNINVCVLRERIGVRGCRAQIKPFGFNSAHRERRTHRLAHTVAQPARAPSEPAAPGTAASTGMDLLQTHRFRHLGVVLLADQGVAPNHRIVGVRGLQGQLKPLQLRVVTGFAAEVGQIDQHPEDRATV